VTYRLLLKPAAERDLTDLPRDVLTRLDARIRSLAQVPRPRGAVKLAGADTLYRVRVGDYRILYEVSDAEQVVRVARVRHRRDVYR
jgi:mRNA interferase RelE/StbE